MNILEKMAFKKKLRPEVWPIIDRIKKLRQIGNTDSEIETIIKNLNLPLGLHLFILGNFSNLMEV